MIVTFSMDAFSALAGYATSPAWHTSMPSGRGIHPIKTQSAAPRFDARRPQRAAIPREIYSTVIAKIDHLRPFESLDLNSHSYLYVVSRPFDRSLFATTRRQANMSSRSFISAWSRVAREADRHAKARQRQRKPLSAKPPLGLE
jgi:hypothetical protein